MLIFNTAVCLAILCERNPVYLLHYNFTVIYLIIMHNTSETVNNFNSDIERKIVTGRRPLVTPVALQFNDSIN